jgi:pimeloyl-ACP methyl ester carboxylesterase
VFSLNDVLNITHNQQTGDNPPRFTPTQPPVQTLRIIPGAVGQIAFGKYLSPDYEVHPGEYIPPVGTLTGTPQVQATNEIYFNLFLPSGPKPAGGWPVAICGSGSSPSQPGSKNQAALTVAASLAAQRIATIAITVVGNDFGPLGTLTVNLNSGGSVTFPAGGRGRDQNGDGIITATEGRDAASIIRTRDAVRQTAIDLMQLVRVIEVGMDVDNDGSPDLDPFRIYYFGHSLGGSYGIALTVIEPRVRAAVLASAGQSVESGRLSPVNRGPNFGPGFASRVPSLINSPGITQLGGVPLLPPYFNENIPLRNQPPLINTVAGAMELQTVMDNREWVTMSGETAAYARHLRHDPLHGMPVKPVIFQFAKGDQTVPNPVMTAILRAGDLADRATYFRNDLAFAANPALPKDPHVFPITMMSPATAEIARTAQQQIAVFFASDGLETIDPDGPEQRDGAGRLFETPIVPPLPEELNFIP